MSRRVRDGRTRTRAMRTRPAWLLSIGSVVAVWAAVSAHALEGQSAVPGAARSTMPPDKPRALLDKYCVTCHNDRVKTANLSLQGLDLAAVPDHAQLWEKVIRKLRAGVMPPPD